MGKPVLCAGAARYTQYATVFLPASAKDYVAQAQKFLDADRVEQLQVFIKEARRVLYFQLFKTSLPFGDYLEAHTRMGYVHLKSFPVQDLLPEHSAAIAAIAGGVLNKKPFLV